MCGIVGEFRVSGNLSAIVEDVVSMRDSLTHRGPDDFGITACANSGVVLGHRRLSIVDLTSAGAQPMVSRDGRYTMVFNGEIYNHLELRLALQHTGVEFGGRSDTEVLLEAISKWGLLEAVKRSVGMFAFAVWDKFTGELSLVRDRFGEKPLAYGYVGHGFVFASELRALRSHSQWNARVDFDAARLLVLYNYVPGPASIYSGISKLPPGAILTVTRSDVEGRRIPSPITYWRVGDYVAAQYCSSLDDAVKETDRLLTRSIAGQMIADVPVGCLLSGGVDSSLVAAIMQRQAGRPIKTFTIGFSEPDYNEAHYASAIARSLGTEHHELTLSITDALNIVPKMASVYDEPFADPSQIPTYLVCNLAKGSVTVALSGDGGDEIFLGYARYFRAMKLHQRLNSIPRMARTAGGVFLDMVNRLGGCIRIHSRNRRFERLAFLMRDPSILNTYLNTTVHHLGVSSVLRNVEPHCVEREVYASSHTCNPMTFLGAVDLETYLPDNNLVKVDRAAMSVSLEMRLPMLDHRLVERALQWSDATKVCGGQAKAVLKGVLDRYVPSELTNRRKMGFGIPIHSWLRGPLREWAHDLLSAPSIAESLSLRPGVLREMWLKHCTGAEDNGFYLWPAIMFSAWLKENS